MAVAYKSAGAGASTETSGVALSPLTPAVVDAGDVLIAHVYFEDVVTTPSTPAGWTLLSGPHVVETTIGRHWVYGRIGLASDDGVAAAFGTQAVTTMRAARIYSFSGRTNGNLSQIIPPASFAATSHATDPQMPSVTTTETGALAVALVLQNDNNALAAATGMSGGTWAEPVAEYVAALTPGFVLQLETCTPTANPGTVSGGAVAATNDPSGVVGFQIRVSAAALTPATETDTAQAITKSKRVTLTPATETDTAQALSFTKTIRKTLTAVTETDAAQALTGYKKITDQSAQGHHGQAHLTKVIAGQTSPVVPPRNYKNSVLALSEYSEFEDACSHDGTATGTITEPLSSVLVPGSPFSIGMWAKITNVAANRTLFQTAGGTGICLITIPAGTSDLTFNSRFGIDTGCTWTGPYPGSGVWHFYGLVYDDTTDIATLYIDGELVEAKSAPGTTPAATSIEFGKTMLGDSYGEFLVASAVTAAQWKRLYQAAMGATLTPATETDAAQVVAPHKAVLLTPAVESDAAQVVDFEIVSNEQDFDLTPAVETDAAQALSFAKHVTVTPATETDSARALSFTKTIYKTLTPVSESDAAQAITVRKRLSLTPVTETDAAQALSVTHVHYRTLTAATEADTAQAITKAKHLTLTPATESDTAQALSFTKTIRKTLTPATESDAAQVLVHRKTLTLTPATESDTAQALSVTHVHYRTLTPVIETDDAQALNLEGTIFRTLSAVVESDSAQALSFTKTIHKALTPASESDSAQALSFSKIIYKTLTPATEADACQPISYTKPIVKTLTPASEADTAQALSTYKLVTVVPASESDECQSISVTHTIFCDLTPAVELDEAQVLVFSGGGGGEEEQPEAENPTLPTGAAGTANVPGFVLAHDEQRREW